MGIPGWPELAAWTASMLNARIAFAKSRRDGWPVPLERLILSDIDFRRLFKPFSIKISNRAGLRLYIFPVYFQRRKRQTIDAGFTINKQPLQSRYAIHMWLDIRVRAVRSSTDPMDQIQTNTLCEAQIAFKPWD
jgi:hypothetical protein